MRSYTNIKIRALFVLTMAFAVSLSSLTLPGDDTDPLTRPDLAPALFRQPALLGMARDLRLSYSGYYTGDGFTDDHRLTLSGYGFGLSFLKEESSGTLFRRYSLAWGIASPSGRNFFGIGFDWFGSGNDPQLDGLTLFRFSWAGLLGDNVLLQAGLRDYVLSDHAYGLALPGAQLGLGFRLWDGLVALHLSVDYDWGGDAALSAECLLRPLAGLELGVNFRHADQESRVGASLALTFGHTRMGSRASFDNGLARSRYSLTLSAQRAKGLIPEGGRVLLVDIAGTIPSQPEEQGIITKTRSRTFLDILRGIDAASRDASVAMLYLRVRGNSLGYGRSEELIATLRRFKKSGKKIYSYLESGKALDYAIASTAGRIYLQPEVNLNLRGVGVSVTFLKGLFDNLGLEAQLFYKGKYKSAAQQLMLDRMSPEHQESEQLLVNRMYEFLQKTIAENRTGRDKNKVASWFKRGLWHADEAVRAGIVNKDWSDVSVQQLFGSFGLRLIRLGDYLDHLGKPTPWTIQPAIAVINISGSIVNGRGGNNPLPVFGGRMAGADTIIEAIRQAAVSPRSRAIILRVQSGGGDLVASDKMWRFINRVRHGKKVYVSFGDIAASGGYYLACGSKERRSRIFAPETCVTGSIGVFTGKVVAAKLKDKIGMRTFFVQAGKRAFYWSGDKGFDADERQLVIRSLDRYYENFVKKVAAGRGLSFQAAEQAARGRVWSGKDALKMGLVDGNLDLWGVVALAAKESGLDHGAYRVIQLPVYRPGVLQSLSGVSGIERLSRLLQIGHPLAGMLSGRVQAILPYAVRYQ